MIDEVKLEKIFVKILGSSKSQKILTLSVNFGNFAIVKISEVKQMIEHQEQIPTHQ